MKIVRSFVRALLLFMAFFIVTLVATALLQRTMRMFVEEKSFYEYVWKSLLMYGVMIAVCIVGPTVSNIPMREAYLARFVKANWYDEEKKWSVKDSLLYTLKTPELLFPALFFIVWTLVFSDMLRSFSNMYFFYAPKVLETVPQVFLCMLTVDIPFFLFYLVSSVCVQHKWLRERKRLLKEMEEQREEEARASMR